MEEEFQPSFQTLSCICIYKRESPIFKKRVIHCTDLDIGFLTPSPPNTEKSYQPYSSQKTGYFYCKYNKIMPPDREVRKSCLKHITPNWSAYWWQFRSFKNNL